MKMIRYIKTMAGPAGVATQGTLQAVTDARANELLAAGAAEVVAHIREDDVLTPDASASSATESAAVESAPEKAITRKAAPKKTSKKA